MASVTSDICIRNWMVTMRQRVAGVALLLFATFLTSCGNEAGPDSPPQYATL